MVLCMAPLMGVQILSFDGVSGRGDALLRRFASWPRERGRPQRLFPLVGVRGRPGRWLAEMWRGCAGGPARAGWSTGCFEKTGDARAMLGRAQRIVRVMVWQGLCVSRCAGWCFSFAGACFIVLDIIRLNSDRLLGRTTRTDCDLGAEGFCGTSTRVHLRKLG